MNDIFNTRRFGLLFKKTLFEQPLQTFGVLALAIVATFLLHHPYKCDANSIEIHSPTEIIGIILLLSGCGLAYFLFSQFSDNAKGYNYLLLPSSYFEKWLVGFLITCVLFFGIYMIFFRLIDAHCVKTFHNALLAHEKTHTTSNVQAYIQQVKVLNYDSLKVIFSMFFLFTGATAIGSLYFNKNAVIKIFLLLIGLIWAYIFLSSFIQESFFKGILINSNPYFLGSVSIKSGGTLTLPKESRNLIENLVYYCLPAAIWLIALIRLREKEI